MEGQKYYSESGILLAYRYKNLFKTLRKINLTDNEFDSIRQDEVSIEVVSNLKEIKRQEK